MSKSAMKQLTQPVQPHASGNHDEWAALLDGLRASAAKQWVNIKHSKRLAKPDGDEVQYIAAAEELLVTVEADIESCSGPATAIQIVNALTYVASMLGVAAGARGGVTRRARNARKKGHESSEQAKAKDDVYLWWKDWQSGKITYKGPTDFARAMLDKHDGTLTSIEVVMRWCRKWQKAAVTR